MRLSILIVNWHSVNYLRACLISLFANEPDLEFEVIVVDNASFDNCKTFLTKEFPTVKFIQSLANIGFAGANNLAFQHSSGENILLLNPDTEITGNAISQMLRVLQELPDAGAVGCRLLNSDGTTQTSCIQSFPTVINQILDSEFLRSITQRSRLWGMAPLFANLESPTPVEVISGACVMLRRDVFVRVKGLDERFFMYYEDVDLSYKVYKANFRCYYVPSAIVVHHGGGSTKSARSTFSNVMMRESLFRYFLINRGLIYATLLRFCICGSALIRICLLSIAVPFQYHNMTVSLRKWISILSWSIGAERWTVQAHARRRDPRRGLDNLDARNA